MPAERVAVKPKLIQWACRRSGKSLATLEKSFSFVARWGEDKQPTFKQLTAFAHRTHTPIDYLLRDEPPPPAQVPLPDMRTVNNREVTEPSLELLDTIHLCQWRQEWYKGYLHRVSNASCAFVGSARPGDTAEHVATDMRQRLAFHPTRMKGTAKDRLQQLSASAEAVGILVMRSSMVRSPHRMLDPQEFRGFALVDDMAPVIFINTADSKGAQTFTFAHELAHVWLGETALSGGGHPGEHGGDIEQWCNRVAAEFLVPIDAFVEEHNADAQPTEEAQRLARLYRVSSLVILIRMHTAGLLDRGAFAPLYASEKERLQRMVKSSGGGSEAAVRAAQIHRASARLSQAVISSVSEGTITFREAYELLGVRNTKGLRAIGVVADEVHAVAFAE